VPAQAAARRSSACASANSCCHGQADDHDQLRLDPIMAVLAGKLEASRSDCAPVAGKSTLNRLELSPDEPTRYHKIAADTAAIEALFVDLFLDAHSKPPAQITLDLDATDDPLHGHQEGGFFHGYYDCYCYLPLYIFCGRKAASLRVRPSTLSVAPSSRAPASEVMAPPSKPATTVRPSTGAKENKVGLQSVGIGGFLCWPITLCCRRTFAQSEPRCTRYL
jgi:hypothetical protein